MSIKLGRCSSRLLKVCTTSSSLNEFRIIIGPFLRNTQICQKSFSTGAPTQAIFSTRRTPFASSSLLQTPHLRAPHLTQSASFISEVDVSTVPREHPEKGRLVYVGTLARTVKFVKAFSVSTSIMGVCIQPYLYLHAHEQPLALTVAIGSLLSFFIFLTPLMLHFITKRYVTMIYYNEQSCHFTATNYTFFVREKDMQFRASDVKIPEVPGIFTTLKVKGTPIFVDPSMFLKREAYIRLMGYDKPIDWRMPDFEQDKKN